METIAGVVLTAMLGTWLAYFWQQRSARDVRYFDASKTQFDLMQKAARDLADLIGQRIYATTRICMLSPDNIFYEEAKENYRQSILNFNKAHLQTDLNIRTLFVSSAVVEFEHLQASMAALSNRITHHMSIAQAGTPPTHDLLRETESLRGEFFLFLQMMIDESDSVFRQMHFGVKLSYNSRDIRHYSTWNLISALFTGPDEQSSVIRAPTDFGQPVSVRDARLGVH